MFSDLNNSCPGGITPQVLNFFLVGWVLIIASGCWEEVYYVPSDPPASNTVFFEAEEVQDSKRPTQEVSSTEKVLSAETGSEKVPAESQLVSEEEISSSDTPPADLRLDETSSQENTLEDSTGETFEDFLDTATTQVEDTTEELSTESSSPAEPELTSEPMALVHNDKARAAWQMGSRWSYAGAIFAKGLGDDYYGPALKEANQAADVLNLTLPDFPTAENETRQAELIRFLLSAGRSQVADRLAANYSPEYAALAELAVKTHVLLLVYTPKSEHLEPIVAAIKSAAEKSRLPTSLWLPLVSLLEERAPFAEVKRAVLQLHEQVDAYLSGAQES